MIIKVKLKNKYNLNISDEYVRISNFSHTAEDNKEFLNYLKENNLHITEEKFLCPHNCNNNNCEDRNNRYVCCTNYFVDVNGRDTLKNDLDLNYFGLKDIRRE